jgi:16S rRNA (cytosine967-C5)-methyltransferase
MPSNSRQVALQTLRSVQQGTFTDVALDRALRQTQLSDPDRRLVTELVYGCVRRRRTLDALIDQLATKPANHQPPDLRLILHLGFYQLRYLNQIPAAAAVNTTVELAKHNRLAGLSQVVNGLLRRYLRVAEAAIDPLQLPEDPIARLGIQYSYPDWIINIWQQQLGLESTAQLCQSLNRSPHIDLRINPLRTTIAVIETAMQQAGVPVSRVPPLPQALRLLQHSGSIQRLPGFSEGAWVVQESSAQLVSHLLDPQPGEVVIDACAAPGGKTTHIVELMADQGVIWACDRTPARLNKLQDNAQRLGLHSIRICTGDSRNLPQFIGQGDRVLLDAPCSGLGTLHRHADARWHQTPETVHELRVLQQELLEYTCQWVKPGGILVYATCTLHPSENEEQIQTFLQSHPDWQLQAPSPDAAAARFATPPGWVKVWPHQHDSDGFFMARLQRSL